MKHEMPVMTEETRQALIDHAKVSILRQKDLMSRHDELLTNDLFQNGMMLVEIALASLEAEPVAHSYQWASFITCEGPQNFQENIEREAPPQWAIEEGQAKDHEALYTAPPVPVMKPIELPPMISSWEGNDAISGRNRGIADCAKAIRAAGYEVRE